MTATRLLTGLIPLLLLITSYLLLGEIRYGSLLATTVNGKHALSLLSNAYHPWQIDPFALALNEFLSVPLSEKTISTISYTIFALGLGTCASFWSRAPLFACLAAGIVPCILQLLFGIDVITIPALAWVPWAIISFTLPSSLNVHLTRILFLTLHISSAGMLSLITLPAIFLLCPSLSREEKKGYLLYSTLLLAIFLRIYAPAWAPPDYPAFGHVISDDGVPGHVWPLISESASIPLIDRVAMRDKTQYIILSLTFLIGFGFIFFRRKTISSTVLLPLLLTCLVWDLVLPENLAIIGPLQTLRRLIPGAFAYSFSEIAIGLALLIVPFVLSNIGTTVVLLLFFLIHWSFQPNFSISNGSFTSQESDELAALAVRDRGRLGRIVISPSFPVIRNYNISVQEIFFPPNTPETKQIRRKLSLEISASQGSLLTVKSIKDRKRHTKVRIGEGGQVGSEWICISLPEGPSYSAIRLSVGDFYSDFPRALKVQEGVSCKDISENYLREKNFNPWEGPLFWTEQGYPYFGPQSDVLLPLLSKTRAIRFEQLGKSRNDWSIAGIEVATLPK